jgi:hypothetical protein
LIPPLGFSSCGRIIQFAMEDAGLLEDGQQPTEEQSAKYLQRLNDVVNFFQTQGLKLFLLQDVAVPLVVSQQTYVFGTTPGADVVMSKPLRVLQAYYLASTLYIQTGTGAGTANIAVASTVVGTQNYTNTNLVTFTNVTTTGLLTGTNYYIVNVVANTSIQVSLTIGGAAVTVAAGTATLNFVGQGIRRPLVPLSWDEWLRLSQPANQGAINSYFVDKQVLTMNLSLWNVPDAGAVASGSVHVLVENQCTNLVTLTDAMAFPVEWFLPLRWGLAADICGGQPDSVIARCEGKALMYREALEGWDFEDAPTRFEPDSRSGYYNNNFRG